MTDSAVAQAEKDRLGRQRHEAWFASLTTAEKREARKSGLDKYVTDYHVSNAENDAEKKGGTDELLNTQREITDAQKRFYDDSPEAKICDALREYTVDLDAAPNVRYRLKCFRAATGVLDDGDIQTEIAKQFNVSRAAVCKTMKQIQKKFHIKPRQSQRDKKTAKSNVQRAHNVHFRQQSTVC